MSVVVLLTSIFLFISKIFFRRSLPIQKYYSDGNFRNCLPTERVFTEQVVNLKQKVNLKQIDQTTGKTTMK